MKRFLEKTLVNLIDTEVSNFIDTDAWEEIEEKEDEDRQEIMKAVDSLRN